jgi:hypothetical protein
LSVGTHTISFRVQDDNLNWSQPSIQTLVIIPSSLNFRPDAFIDIAAPNPSREGKQVNFTCHGTDKDGIVVRYDWESDKDGFLSNATSFLVSKLSIGDHIISLKVQDNDGAWSTVVYQ